MERGPADQAIDLAGDPGTFRLLARGLVEDDRWPPGHRAGRNAGGRRRVQVPSRYERRRGDGLDRSLDDGGGGPVVAGEIGRARRRVVGAEAQEESDVRAAKSINGLIGIADHGEAVSFAGQQAEQVVLLLVQVLVLVHADPGPAVGQLRGDGRLRPEQPHREGDELIHIDQATPEQFRAQRLAFAGRPFAGRPFARPAAGFQRGDQPASVPFVAGDARGCLEPGRLVGHRVTGRQAGLPGMLAEYFQGQPVKRGHQDLRSPPCGWRTARVQEAGEPLPHLLGRAPAEGEGRNPLRGYALPDDRNGDPVCQRAGLSGPRTSDDHERAISPCCGALFLVQFGQ